jgi:phytoene dehydrogenase-like protein
MLKTPTTRRSGNACVVGAGPNGLAAAIVLAQAGMTVEVYEAQPTIGGAARTMELTLPGFRHDFGSAVHPMAAGSPFFTSLPLHQFGLEWIDSPAPLAHPLDNGRAVMLERDLAAAEAALGEDGPAWLKMMQPLVSHWSDLSEDILGPVVHLPRHPLLLARFGMKALLPAATLAKRFRGDAARALFAGIAAHSFLSLDQPLSASFALVLGASAHVVGWPIPRGGAQAITDALASYLVSLGGTIRTSARVDRLADLPPCDLILCDVTPRQLLAMTEAYRGQPDAQQSKLSDSYRRSLAEFKYGPAAFKVDYALSQPIPWNAPECARAATVHLGATLEEIAASEKGMTNGRVAERPFVLLSQPTLFDPTRAPDGKHIAWAYCHVPNSSTEDMLERIESQIERFASGFRDCVLARHISTPADLEAHDANLVGGDIMGGAPTPMQLAFRPTSRLYRTSSPKVYLCSASTPPGGGVHGMCGYNAAKLALRDLARQGKKRPPLFRDGP